MTLVAKVSLKGTLPGGEVFSVNPVWNIGTTPVSAAGAAAIATAIDAVTIPSDVLAMIPASCAWTASRVEIRDSTDGSLQSVGEHVRSSPSVGSGSLAHPFQTAMVISLRTTLSGARRRGRLYFPAISVPLTNTTLRLGSSNVDLYMTGVKAYLALVETAIKTVASGAVLVVWSRTDGGTTLVTTLQAGDIMDVQRRRRDSVVESYTTKTWP